MSNLKVRYQTTLKGIRPAMLKGFFVGWRNPLTPQRHLRALKNSTNVVLAIDSKTNRVVGFINALTDRTNAAFIPLLEVLPEYQKRGIGSELVKRMLTQLKKYPCIDLCCDPQVQPFYERHGMQRMVGMLIRDYKRKGPRG